MRSALIDNWTIERIIDNFSNNKNMISKEVETLMIAMVLWEDVYYFDNGYSSWWRYIVDNMEEYSFLKQLKPTDKTPDSTFLKEAKGDYLRFYSQQYTSVVAQGALEYLYFANEKKLSYIPWGNRATFIQENDLYRHFNIFYNRIDAIERVDVEILRYYEELNQMLTKTRMIFHPNCLLDYISKSADSVTDMFKNVNELKKLKMVKDFRKWVTDLEDDIKEGRTIKIMQYKKDLESIEKTYQQMSIDVSLGIPAGIGINLSVPFEKINQPNLVFPIFLYGEAIGASSNYLYKRKLRT